ncbi:conserved hypothetical protein [Candidatus Zixiibacteriota bacterium]|nr:conserved hypothetical protein [candidate division Zixibacteria bacterium]
MFNFLNSAVLIAAAAALIPLLIHLFSRRRVKIVPFSSLKHLKEMQKRQVRRIKIRQLLLLLLRMLIILAAVLAFARPATRGGYIGSHAGVSAVVLLDKSASMQRQVKDGVLFDLAKKKAEEILKNFGQGDELLLIPFDREAYFPAGEQFFSREVAENILKAQTVGYDSGNFGEAFRKGAELLVRAKNLNKECYLISDFQANSLPSAPESLGSDFSVYLADLPVETDGNCGVTGVNLGGQLIEVGNEFTVEAEIRNFDNRPKNEQLASLFVDGNRVMQSEFRIDALGKQSVQFKHTVPSAGFHSGWVEIGDDGYSPDNRYYFTFKIPEQFNILIVNGDGSGNLVRLALVPSEDLGRYWSVKTVAADELAAVNLNDYDAVVLAGVPELGAVETLQLQRFMDDGGGVFFVMSANIKTEYFDRNFSAKIGLRIVKPVPTSFSGAGYYSLERLDYAHPIFRAFAQFQKEDMPSIKFYALPTLQESPDCRILAYFSNGSAALAEGAFGAGKMIVMTAPLRPEYTDLAAHSFFVPLIIRTMEYLAGAESSYELKNYVGGKITRTVPAKLVHSETVEMTAPDKNISTITGKETGDEISYDCQPIQIPGIYQLQSQGRTIDIFPANVVMSESDLAAAEPEQIGKALGLKKYTVLPFSQSSDTVITQARYGRELWKIFLWAAVVLLAVEMILAREKETESGES